MDDITMEKKLKLVQQVKSRYHENQNDLAHREHILYGYPSDTEEPEEASASSGSFRLRIFLAGILFACVILCDKFGIRPAGLDPDNLFSILSEDYQEEIVQSILKSSGETAQQ